MVGKYSIRPNKKEYKNDNQVLLFRNLKQKLNKVPFSKQCFMFLPFCKKLVSMDTLGDCFKKNLLDFFESSNFLT